LPYFSDKTVCSSSIQNFFKSKNIMCNRLKIDKKVTNYTNFRVPSFSSNEYEPTGESTGNKCDYLEVYEWLGACALGVEM